MEHIPMFLQSGRSGVVFGSLVVSLMVYSVRSYLRSRLRIVAAGAGAVRR